MAPQHVTVNILENPYTSPTGSGGRAGLARARMIEFKNAQGRKQVSVSGLGCMRLGAAQFARPVDLFCPVFASAPGAPRGSDLLHGAAVLAGDRERRGARRQRAGRLEYRDRTLPVLRLAQRRACAGTRVDGHLGTPWPARVLSGAILQPATQPRSLGHRASARTSRHFLIAARYRTSMR